MSDHNWPDVATAQAISEKSAHMIMADRPIIMSAPMVRALLDGRKTQTRRIIKPVRGYEHHNICRPDLAAPPHDVWWHGEYETVGCTQSCPFGQIGDRLWVREGWKPHSTFDHLPPREMPKSRIFYLADPGYSPSGSRSRPSIHMPRWASRLTLTVTDVRAQRLQDISEEDAIAEGVYRRDSDALGALYSFERVGDPAGPKTRISQPAGFERPEHAFCNLWERLHGRDAWDANPWVWALSFSVAHHNIDDAGIDHG